MSHFQKIVDNRLFTGSFDGTMRVWDLTELAADKGTGANTGGAKEKNKMQSYDSQDRESIEMKNQPRGQKMMIENEKSYYNKQQSNPYPNSNNYSKSMDQRSEADSGFDDRDYADKYNQRQGQPRRLQVREVV